MANKAILTGRTGGDVELVTFQNGGKILRCTLATSQTWNDKESGEKKTRTEWHSLQFPGYMENALTKYVGKGSLIYVEGEIRYNDRENEDGSKTRYTNIHVNIMEMLQTKEPGDGSQQQQPQTQQHKPQSSGDEIVDEDFEVDMTEGEDDLPF